MLTPLNRKIKFYISDTCNERCIYCPIHGDSRKTYANLLSADQIARIASEAIKLGYIDIKLSAEYGDPLMRKDLEEIVSKIKAHNPNEISIASNAMTSTQRIDTLIANGVTKMCLSLDTLNEAKYKDITGVSRFSEVKQAIEHAAQRLKNKVKVNMVVMAGVNSEEIAEMREWTASIGAILQLIEVYEVEGRQEESAQRYYCLDQEVCDLRSEAFYFEEFRPRAMQRFVFSNGSEVEVTSTRRYSDYFFGDQRLLVHPDGDLANYDVRRTGLKLSGDEEENIILARLSESSRIGINDIGKPGITPWGRESSKVS